jgi:hypothetical protein
MKAGISIIAIVCSVLCPLYFASAVPITKSPSAVTDAWIVLNQPDLGFSVKVPRTAKNKDNWDIVGNTHNWMVRSIDSIYSIQVQEYNDAMRPLANREDVRTGMLSGMPNGFFKGIEQSSGGTVYSPKMVREFKLSEYPAREYTYSFLSKDGRSSYEGRTVFCVNDKRAYIFCALSSLKPDPAPPFFASIQLK